jgi:hypothetical protein
LIIPASAILVHFIIFAACILLEQHPRFAMGDWHKVATRKEKTRGTKVNEPKSSTALSEAQIKHFLATFKTVKCNVEGHHDPRICEAFHDVARDRRRNPYVDYYGPDDCLNNFEKMYHPSIFRTTMCHHGEQQCDFGKLCSHAHSSKDLRDRSSASASFESLAIVDSRPLPRMASFVPEREKREYYSECQSLWSELRLETVSNFVVLQPEHWFLVDRSETLFSEIEKAAFMEGMGCVSRLCKAGQHGLLLRGLHLESTQRLIDNLLSPPSPHFALEERQYGERVVSSLSVLLQSKNGRRLITSSDNVLIQPLEGDRQNSHYCRLTEDWIIRRKFGP